MLGSPAGLHLSQPRQRSIHVRAHLRPPPLRKRMLRCSVLVRSLRQRHSLQRILGKVWCARETPRYGHLRCLPYGRPQAHCLPPPRMQMVRPGNPTGPASPIRLRRPRRIQPIPLRGTRSSAFEKTPRLQPPLWRGRSHCRSHGAFHRCPRTRRPTLLCVNR